MHAFEQIGIPHSPPPSPANSTLSSPTASPVNTHDHLVDPELTLTFSHSYSVPDLEAPTGRRPIKGSKVLKWSLNKTQPNDLKNYCIDHAETDGISVTPQLRQLSEALASSVTVWTVWVVGSKKFRKNHAMRVFFPPGRWDAVTIAHLTEFLKEAHEVGTPNGPGSGAGISFRTSIKQHVALEALGDGVYLEVE